MRIVQITDLHIGREGEDTFDTDVRGNFRKVLSLTKALNPNHIVLSGDLCFDDPEEEVYEWVRRQMEQLRIPYDLISGNHDDPVMMARLFNREEQLQDGELYYKKMIGDKDMLFLDTTTGEVSARQLDWLKQQMKDLRGPALLFMHHPPFLSKVPHMDRKYALQNREEVQETLFSYPFPVHVFSGHYHVDKTLQQKNVMLYITPACFFQIDQHEEDFKVDHRIPGLREITLENDTVLTTVKYARG